MGKKNIKEERLPIALIIIWIDKQTVLALSFDPFKILKLFIEFIKISNRAKMPFILVVFKCFVNALLSGHLVTAAHGKNIIHTGYPTMGVIIRFTIFLYKLFSQN